MMNNNCCEYIMITLIIQLIMEAITLVSTTTQLRTIIS
jgi:hypothetical protein